MASRDTRSLVKNLGDALKLRQNSCSLPGSKEIAAAEDLSTLNSARGRAARTELASLVHLPNNSCFFCSSYTLDDTSILHSFLAIWTTTRTYTRPLSQPRLAAVAKCYDSFRSTNPLPSYIRLNSDIGNVTANLSETFRFCSPYDNASPSEDSEPRHATERCPLSE